MKVELLRGFLPIFVKSYHFILYNILCIYLAMFISNPASFSCMYMCSSPIIRSQSVFQHLIDLHQQTEAGTGNRAFLSHDCTITKGVHNVPYSLGVWDGASSTRNFFPLQGGLVAP